MTGPWVLFAKYEVVYSDEVEVGTWEPWGTGGNILEDGGNDRRRRLYSVCVSSRIRRGGGGRGEAEVGLEVCVSSASSTLRWRNN